MCFVAQASDLVNVIFILFFLKIPSLREEREKRGRIRGTHMVLERGGDVRAGVLHVLELVVDSGGVGLGSEGLLLEGLHESGGVGVEGSLGNVLVGDLGVPVKFGGHVAEVAGVGGGDGAAARGSSGGGDGSNRSDAAEHVFEVVSECGEAAQ